MSIETLKADLNILQHLVIPFLEDDIDVIQKLDDEPNDVGGLTSAQLKAKFDESSNIIKTYINEVLIPTLSDTVAEAEVRAEAEAQRQENEAGRVEAENERRKTFGTVLEAASAARDAAKGSEQAALESKNTSDGRALDSEAYALGTRNGAPVQPGDPAYENNAKHYSEKAKDIAGGEYDVLGSAKAVRDDLTPQIAHAELLAKSQMGGAGGATGELEDLTVRLGYFTNTGAGWNSYRFPVPFDAPPVVVLQPENFVGWAEIKNVTADGFLYCLRQPVYTAGQNGTAGSVSTGEYFTGAGTGSSTSHSKQVLVNGVTLPGAPVLPTAENKTTAAPVVAHWMALEENGDEGLC